MIKILTGWSNPGGSTTSHINLCRLFNQNDMKCVVYGPHDWHKQFESSGNLSNANIQPEDHVIVHFLDLTERPQCQTLTYSCHETNVKPISSLSYQLYDVIHYVSHYQRGWHQIDYNSVIIPNVLDELKVNPKNALEIAGVIGSIDRHKQTHLSIQRALNMGYEHIVLCGEVTDMEYFQQEINPLLLKYPKQITQLGYLINKQRMYDNIHEVFHSSKRETFNLVKAECQLTGTRYNGLESAESGGVLWAPERILEAWKRIFYGDV